MFAKQKCAKWCAEKFARKTELRKELRRKNHLFKGEVTGRVVGIFINKIAENSGEI
jgi:hypothetical protein